MYRRIDDFKQDWARESAQTLKVFEAIAEDKKAERLNDNIRSLERLAWHLTQTLAEMPHKAGLLQEDTLEHTPVPQSFAGIISTYKEHSHKVLEAVTQKWTDDNLEEEVNMYGEPWKKGMILSVLILHQTHHRGQMTALMRMLGMQVPGVYGPSKEEWVKFGMQPME